MRAIPLVQYSQHNHRWIASLYFLQSIPFVVVSLLATLMYQQRGVDNATVALLTSLLTLPWAIKPLFAPFLENIATKKRITITMQLVIAVLFFALSFCVESHYFLESSFLLLLCLAIASSIHDIAADGFYLINLSRADQTRYVALRSFFYQMGRLSIKGGLLAFIAYFANHENIPVWPLFFLCLGSMVLVLCRYHVKKMPEIETIKPRRDNHYFVVFKTLLLSRQYYPALLFIFLYNSTDAQMQKIIPLFLLDKMGLNLNLSQVGDVYGILGSLFLMLGIYFSGLLIARYSLASCMKWLTFFLALGHGLFVVLASKEVSPLLLYAIIAFNQLTVGLANGAYMGYLLNVANKSDYPMSMYTLCTAMMALSVVFFGSYSGIVEQYLGYTAFFMSIFVMNLVLIVFTYQWMSRDV